METKYAVSQWIDDERGCANGSEDRHEFDTLEEATTFYKGIDLESRYKTLRRSDWRTAARIACAKDLCEVRYNDDGERIDSEYNPIEYDEYSKADMEADA